MQKSYRRRLPHILKDGATYFVTFRLYGSVPMSKIEKLQHELLLTEQNIRSLNLTEDQSSELLYLARKQFFGRYDSCLDKPLNGPYWLARESVAKLVHDAFLFFQTNTIKLHCLCIMSNHVHALFTPLSSAPPLYDIMRKIKSYTGKYGNGLLNLSGQFWERESYDHIVRNDGEFWRILRYILNNPVKAKLVNNWKKWRWSWVSPELAESL